VGLSKPNTLRFRKSGRLKEMSPSIARLFEESVGKLDNEEPITAICQLVELELAPYGGAL
jgi:hypothetical protein